MFVDGTISEEDVVMLGETSEKWIFDTRKQMGWVQVLGALAQALEDTPPWVVGVDRRAHGEGEVTPENTTVPGIGAMATTGHDTIEVLMTVTPGHTGGAPVLDDPRFVALFLAVCDVVFSV